MDFTVPPRVAELLPRVRSFVEERIQPLERRLDEDWSVLATELEGIRYEVRRRGWWAPFLAQDHAGMGVGVSGIAFPLGGGGGCAPGPPPLPRPGPRGGQRGAPRRVGSGGAEAARAGAAPRGEDPHLLLQARPGPPGPHPRLDGHHRPP